MDKNNLTVPYIAYESMLDREDRQHTKMVMVIVLLTVILVATNAIWIYMWNSRSEQELPIVLETSNEDEQDG